MRGSLTAWTSDQKAANTTVCIAALGKQIRDVKEQRQHTGASDVALE